MDKIRQITIIILILFSVFCAEISEATTLLPGLTLHKEKDSVVVYDVQRGSKAWEVGIKRGDILLKIDDQEIKILDDYVKKTKSTSRDETVTLIFLRHGEEYVIIKDSNNYHKKNKVIEQYEKTIITDNEISTEKPLTIGISYNQIMEYLDQYISMSKSSDVRSQPRYMGQTSDDLAILEIIGNKKDVSQATLMIGIPNDAPKILVRNTAILLRFMENVAPEWKLGSDWATSALERVSSTGEPEEIIRGSKSIKLSLIKVLGIVSVTVKHKNAI